MAEGHLSLTINQIADELNSEECKTLFYLCGNLDKCSSNEDVKDMLKALLKSGQVDHQFLLLELTYRIKRFDILKRVLMTNRKEVESILGRKCFISDYRVLMADVSEELGKEDVRSFIFLLSDTLPRMRLEKAKSFLDVIVELEKVDMVSHENLDLIEQCLRGIHRIDLAKKINVFQRKGAKSTADLQIEREKRQCFRPSPEASSSQAVPQTVFQKSSTAHAPEKIKTGVPETGMQYSQLEDVYRMQTDPRGICLIIDCVGNDGDMLHETFTKLRFKVILYKWLSLNDTLAFLKETARMTDHQRLDCFVCCIISRGTATGMLGTETQGPGLLFDNIRQLFTPEHCPGLLGKPKLFFIQNYVLSEPVPYYDDSDDIEADMPVVVHRVESIPTEADLFWSYCETEAGHLEKVHHSSVYFQALSAGLIKGQKRKMDLIDVHTEVNGMIYDHNQRNPTNKYCISLRFTLRKNFILS
ncbi:CASP8 and FADD-like apoptosis regulator isoform X2 [Lepisosteus oculatus]|uniref:CASP8 and FADD-like apoptosis regulator a n=1 Tax=Lepisosteus oculatus TaxID=7918 RepID=W5MUJ7_LEPOC|nr:PREDICTED: CASP8 and FADD-like apoptosis regulator isoform X2 [Lepisosteus oculatus]